jgi:hypothetical protein
MKRLTLSAALIAAVVLFSCKSQPAGAVGEPVDEFKVGKVVYHLSRCNGTCPSMDLEIDSARNVYVNREFYKTKSLIDSANSGTFKGKLTPAQDSLLTDVLKKSNLDSLAFPEVGIADVSETTIIVYYNGKRKHLTSARPPEVANDLITFLKSVGNDTTLVRTTEVKELEK